jgi:excinuclease ABC subunit C
MTDLEAENPPISSLEFKRKHLPFQPGVYLYRNRQDQVIYVGKAKSLRKRVNSYWKERSRTEDPIYAQKVTRMIQEITDIEVIVVENETEALILENELIKEHQPRFNMMLKDDKSYPWVRITNEKFPRIKIIRGPERHGLQHKYIGPFVDGFDLKKTLRFIRKIFPYCTCKTTSTRKKRTRPCVFYQIKLCPGPCQNLISEKEYRQNITNIELLLSGEIAPIEQMMTTKMQDAAAQFHYEEAAEWRDRLAALQQFTVEQSIITYDLEHPEKTSVDKDQDTIDETREAIKLSIESRNFDVIAGHMSKIRAGIVIIHVRAGRVIGKTPYVIEIRDKVITKDDFALELIKQHYFRPNIPIPDEIIVETAIPLEISESLEKFLATSGREKQSSPSSSEKTWSINFHLPHEEDKTAGIMRIAKKNVELLISQRDDYEQYLKTNALEQEKLNKAKRGLQELQDLLGLEDPPLIIEGFDMAHFQGTDYTGSMVCMVEGKPSKKHYRHYKIRSVDKPDDIAAMREVLTRRYTRAIKEDTLPDLVIVDGGVGQLNMTHQLFQDLGIDHVQHIGLVKPEGRSEIYTPPQIVVPDSSEKITLTHDSPALHIIQYLRNESHRFANAYHKKLRNKRQTKSELDDIPGIGPARKTKLLQIFGSVREIKAASMEELTSVIGSKLATVVYTHFQQKKEQSQIQAKSGKKKIVLKKKKTKNN